MLNIIKKETGKFEITADAEIFIIPNRAARINDFLEFSRERILTKAEKLSQDNGKIFDRENDYMVEVWMHSKDLESDNMNSHGSFFNYEGKEYVIGSLSTYIPRPLIEMKEKEITTLRYNDLKCRDDDGNKFDVDLVLNMRANQLDYRYGRSGSFEEVLEHVCI